MAQQDAMQSSADVLLVLTGVSNGGALLEWKTGSLSWACWSPTPLSKSKGDAPAA